MTTVGINDGMSKALKSVISSVNALTSGFEHMQRCAATPIPTGIGDSIKRDIAAAQREISKYERRLSQISGLNVNVSNTASAIDGLQQLANNASQAERQIQNTSTALSNLTNWNSIQGINVIDSSGSERLIREMHDYSNMVNGISSIQDKLKINVGSMDRSILPQNAISDITHAENRINSLIQSMQRMSSTDVSMLNTSQIENMNNSFESMRQNANSIISTMSGINSSLSSGNVNELNSGFQQLNSLAEQAQRQIRSTEQALNAINSVRNWNNVNTFEIMQGSGTERLQMEIDSYRRSIEQINNLQIGFNINSSPIRNLLPPNAIADITQAENRINGLSAAMQAISNTNISILNTSQVESMSNVFEGLRQNANMIQSTMANIGSNINNNNVEALNTSFQQLNVLAEQAQRQIRNTGQVLNEINGMKNWNSIQGINTFGNTGMERLQKEMNDYKNMVSGINNLQNHLQSNIGGLDRSLLPQNAISDITHAENRINSLIQSMQRMSSADISMLNPSQIENMNSSFESMRQNASSLINTLSNLNVNISSSNIDAVNSGFQQLINLASQAENQIRGATTALNTINNVHWQGVSGGQELFNSTGQLRMLQEMSSLNQMFQRLKQSQDQITQNASHMSILPPNAQQDFDLLNSRVYGLTNTIRALEREKGRLSRFDISGINSFNNRIESLRSQLQNALTMQERINSAISSSSFENVNREARELNDILNNIGRQIRDNNDQQQQFNSGTSSSQTGFNGLLSAGNMFGMALANNIVNSAKQVIDSSIHKIIEVTENSFKDGLTIIKSEKELQARLGNDRAGTTLYNILAKDAKTSVFDESQMLKVSSGFLPYVKSTNQLQDLSRITEILSLFDKTGQGATGASFALRELIGGSAISMARRFDVSPNFLRSFDLDKLGSQDMDKFIEKMYEMLEALNMSEEAYKKMLEAPSTQIDMFTTNLKTAFAKAATDGIDSLSPLINNLNNMLEGEKADRFFGIVGEGFTNIASLGERAYTLINNNADSLLDTMENFVTVTDLIGNGFMSMIEWIDQNEKSVKQLIGAIGLLTLNPIAISAILPDPKEVGFKLAESFVYVNAGAKTTELVFKHLGDFVLTCFDYMAIGCDSLRINVSNQFAQMKIAGIRAFQDLANSVVDALNSIGQFTSTALGTKFTQIDYVTVGNSEIYNTMNDSILKNLQSTVSSMERQSNINKRNESWEAGKRSIAEEFEKEMAATQRNINNYKNRFNPYGNSLTDTNNEIMTYFANSKLVDPFLTGSAVTGDGDKDIKKVGSVDKINEPINLANEDLKSISEFANIEAINQFTQQTLAPQVTVTFGDVRESADVSKILDEINEKLIEEMAASSDRVPTT